MSKYGEVAVIAVHILKEGGATNPREAWEKAAKKVFPTNTNLQNKGCPKSAFIGLCDEGMIEGVHSRTCPEPGKNAKYAVDAVEMLRKNRFLVSQPNLLWKKVAGNTKSENHQMDVVVGLWETGCIST